jgi:cell division protein FtsI/penicillin-binding protein 2
MRSVRFALAGILLLLGSSRKVITAQLSSPYAQRIDQAKSARAIAVDRQRHLLADSEKSVNLSVELRREINQATPDTLWADTLNKTVEIEKLARDLRKQMKD